MPTNDGSDVVDLIKITVGDTVEVKADAVTLTIDVRGSSLVSANEAQTKVKEVAVLISQLRSTGLAIADIEVAGARLELSGSTFKIGEPSYTVDVTCRPLELMPSVLEVIASQRQKLTNLSACRWSYSGEASLRSEMLDRLIEEAKTKAVRVARSLGVQILAMHRFQESTNQGSEVKSHYSSKTSSFSNWSPGNPVEITQSKDVKMQIEIEYRVSSIQ